jgi:DNA-binding MarR family transcriptional regulator
VVDGDLKPISDEYFVLWIMIAQTRDAILKARERDYARFNISNMRRAVLWNIQNNGGHSTPVEISRHLFRELHSVTGLLERMEKEELITKFKSLSRSRFEVKLTKKGLDVLNQSLYNETDKRIFSILTKKQRERLASYLWKLRGRVFQELGLPEWRYKFPADLDAVNINENQNYK